MLMSVGKAAERQLSSHTPDLICPSSWPRPCFQENISEGKRMVSFVQISLPRGQSRGSLHLHYPLILWIHFPPNKQVFLPKKMRILIGHRAVLGPSLESCLSFPESAPVSLWGPFFFFLLWAIVLCRPKALDSFLN